MKPIELTIIGSARTKKNHSRIITNPKTGKPMVIQSKQYVQYEADALKQLHKPSEPVTCACNAQYRYYMPNARKCDLVNLIQATNDILVKGGVIEDDNYTEGVDAIEQVIYKLKMWKRKLQKVVGEKQ